MTSRARGRAGGLAVVCALATLLTSRAARGHLPTDLPPDDGSGAGPYRVLTVEPVILHDAARRRDIALRIHYPDAPGPFPVIVFSHGALASKDAYADLGRHWASYGYVTVHPSHADSIADGGFGGTLRDAIDDPRAWGNRARDVSFVLDALAHIGVFAPRLAGKLDLRHVGVAGHSFGAYTAALIGGTTVRVPGRAGPQGFADRRAKAVVLLSPQGEGCMGLDRDSWDHLRLPVLVMYGSRDFGPYGQPPAWRNEPYLRAPPGDKYDVELQGATHMRFAGSVAIAGGPPDRLFECVESATLTFWDAYLKGDAKARRALATRALPDCGAGEGLIVAK